MRADVRAQAAAIGCSHATLHVTQGLKLRFLTGQHDAQRQRVHARCVTPPGGPASGEGAEPWRKWPPALRGGRCPGDWLTVLVVLCPTREQRLNPLRHLSVMLSFWEGT